MANVRHKDPALLVNRRGSLGRGRGVTVSVRPEGFRAPPLPPEVTTPLTDPAQARFQPAALRHTRLVWREWWRSQPSLGVDMTSDMEAIHWWIICVFRRSVYIQFVLAQPLVKNQETGAVTTNPLERTIAKLTADIDRAAVRFGMDTLSRFRLHFEEREPVAEQWRPLAPSTPMDDPRDILTLVK